MVNPNGPSGSWHLTFEDTFPGTSLNTTFWQIGTGTVNNVQCSAANIIVNNGLTLQLANSNSGAEIFTNTAYNLPVGSVCEARIWFPGPGGTPGTSIYNWPAWWVSGPNWPNAGEIDIAEGLGTLTVNYHGPGSSSYNTGTVAGNWSNSWHTYTLRRNASSFDVWYDGVLVRSNQPTADNGSPQNMILNVGAANTAAYGSASYMMVSYVRQWAPVNVSVDFTSNVAAVDPLGAGFVISEFGGNPIPFLSNDSNWNTTLTALGAGHMRASIAWYGGNPGYGAGGSPRQQGSGGSVAASLVTAIKAAGAVPLISFNGDTADNNFNPADGGSLVSFFNGGSGGYPSASGTLTQTGGNAGQQFQRAAAGPYLFQFNEWNSTQACSINYAYNAGTGVTSFSVASSSISVSTSGAPGSYPSLVSGNHAVGSPNYTSPASTQFPIQNSAIATGQVLTSVAGTVPGTGAWDFAYDIWFSSTPNPTGGVGNNGNGLEMMIWLNHLGGIQPAGTAQASVTIGGVSWTPWVHAQGPISYVRNTPVNSVSNLDLKPFIADAISRGLMTNAWYLIDVECGFEIWTGGTGLAITSFSCTNGGPGSSGGQHGGPVKYWSIGNEPGNSAPYTSGSGQGSAPATLAAMLAADSSIVVGAPAAFHWDSAFLTWAGNSSNMPGLGALSYHAYDGFDTDDSSGAAFPNGRQIYNHIKTDIPAMKPGAMRGIEEMNWHATYNGTQFNDWHNTTFLADNIGQALSAGGHATIYSDSNGGLGLLNDGGGQGQIGAKGTPQAAYWALGIWTGMAGQFKKYGANMVSATTTFSLGSVTPYASDNGKIVIINKDASTAHALTIGLTLPGGATSGTYNVWATNQASPTAAITKVVNGAAFSGGVINYTIPAGTAVSIDVTSGGASPVTLTNNFEGGTNGTTLTTGNTGGSSGNAFDAVNITNAAAVAFSNTQKAHGSLSAALSTSGTAGVASFDWAGSFGTQAVSYGRAYVYLTAAPAADDTIIQFSNGGTFGGGIMATASGLLAVQNAAFGITLGPALPLNQWLRIEWKAVAGTAGTASLAVNYYLLDSITSSGSVTDITGAYGSGGGVGEVSYGWNTAHASQPVLYIDDVGISNAGFLGPVVSTQTRSAALSGSGTLTAGGAAAGAGLLSNNFEGGTNGTAITSGNSGGSSGNAFDTVTTVAGGVTQFSSAQATHGSLSGQFSTGSTSGVSVVQWSSSSVGTQTTLYGRAYVYLTANPASDDNIVAFYGGSSSFAGGVMIANSGQLRIQNAGFGEVAGGPTVPLNQWFRLEWKIVCGSAGSASAALSYYSTADITTPPTSILVDTTGAWGSGGSINQVQFGWTGGHANQSTVYLDNIGLSTTGFLGPVVTLTPSSAALSGSGTLTVTSSAGFAPPVNMTGTGTLSGTTSVDAPRGVALSGSGSLSAAGLVSGAASLSGQGTLGIAQVTPKLQTLQDAFLADDLSDLWAFTFGTVSVANGQCAIQCDSSYSSALYTGTLYDLTNSYLFARMTPYTAASAETGITFTSGGSSSNEVVFFYSHGQLAAKIIQGGVTTAGPSVSYDPAAHAWWRIREQGSTLYWEYGPDGVSWTALWTYAGYTLDLTSGNIFIWAGLDSGSDPAGTSYVTSVNYRAGAGSFPGTFPGVVGLVPPAAVVPVLLQFAGTPGGSGTEFPLSISTASGSTLVAHIVGWGTAPMTVAVTDSTVAAPVAVSSPAVPGEAVPGEASPGVIAALPAPPPNEWVIVSSDPVFSAANGQYGISAIAYCIGAQAVANVTVSFSSAVYGEVGIGEWADVAAGAIASGVNNALETTASYITPQLTVPEGSLLAVAASAFGTFTSVAAPLTLASFGGDHDGAYGAAPWPGTFAASFSGPSTDVPNSVIVAFMPAEVSFEARRGERMGTGLPSLQLGMLGSTLASGYQGGPSGAAKVAPSAAGNGWEIWVRSGTDYVTLLAQIPNSMLVSFQFVRQLNDIGSGTVVLNMDDPWWKVVTLPGGLPAHALLDQECLWQVYKDGVCRFEFLGETVTEQLADQSEQRIATVTGPGAIAALKWAMLAPLGFPNIVLKLDGLLDTFDEVDASGKGVVDPNIWTIQSPASHIYTTPIGTLYNYPQGAGYALSSLYPSGSLTIVASPAVTFLGASPYDATDTLISAQITPLGVNANQADSVTPAKYGANMNGSELTQFYIQSNKNQQFYALFGLSASAFYAQIRDRSGTYTKILPAYNPSNHAYWMITEQGGSGGGSGTFYWWTSPDGQNWTKQWTALHHWDATNCTFLVTASYSADNKVSMQLANLNSNVSTPSYQGQIYLGTPMMGVWLDQFRKAQARGSIPFVTSQLTALGDSYGRPWTDTQNVQTVNGTDLYSFLQSAASVVNADYVMDPGFQLRVGQPATGQVSLGVDRAAYMIFRDGHDSISRQRIRARNQIVTVLGGENADGHEISATAPAFVAQWGKREGWFQTSVLVDPVSMAYATAASLAENETEILSHTLTITPNLPGRTVFDDFDVGDWVGLERPDFSAVDDIRVVGIAVQVDSNGNETHELTVSSYIQWLAEQLAYLAGKLGGQFVNTLGATPVAPSKYGTGQVPTYYTPAATLAGLADVAGGAGGSTLAGAPLVYNAATGQYQHAGSTDPATGQTMPAVVTAPGQGAVVSLPDGMQIYDPSGTLRTVTGLQPDGSITTSDYNGAPPLSPDNPGVGGAIGGVAVSWDGLLSGTAPLSDFQYVQVHLGLSATFMPSPTTLMGTLHTAGTLAINNLAAGTAYWAKLVAVNTSGNSSAPSAGVSGVAQGVSAADLTGQLPASVLGNSAGAWALNPNPFFNGGDLSGWTAVGATLSTTSTVPGLAPGNAQWVATLISTVAGGDMDGSPAPFPVVAGQPYAMTAWVYNPGASPAQVQVGFNWTGGSQAFTVPPGVWSPLTTVQTAPDGTVSAYQVIQLIDSGVTVNVSAALAAGQVPGGLIAAHSIAADQISTTIILAGIVDGTLIQGAQFVAYGTSGDILVYSGPPTVGNLIGSWSPDGGNDAALAGGTGNNYPVGLMVGPPGSSQVVQNPQVNQPFNLTTAVAGILTAVSQYLSGDTAEVLPGLLGALNLGTGGAAKQTLVATSPFTTTAGAAMLLESENDAGTDTAMVTFGTVSSPDGGTTMVFTPIMLLTPYAMVLYSGSASQVVVTKTSGSGTIPIPGGVTTAKAEAWGDSGGSAGGSSASAINPGGGAGGGEYSCEPNWPVPPGGSVSYAVGAGGAAGNGTNAGAGSGSSLTGTGPAVFAFGGGGGLLGIGGTGGAGGSGSVNTIHFPGGRGGYTTAASGTVCGGGGGGGSGGPGGPGRQGGDTDVAAGGTGAVAQAGGAAGGSGGKGSSTGAGGSGALGRGPGGGPGGGGNALALGMNAGNGRPGTAGQVRLTYLTGTPSVGFVINYGASFTDQYGNVIPAGPNMSTDASGGLVLPGTLELDPPGYSPAAPAAGVKLFADSSATAVTSLDSTGFSTRVGVTGAADFTPRTVTQATQNQLGTAWTIPAGNAQVGTAYRVTSKGYGTWGSTQQFLQLIGAVNGTNVTEGGGNGRIAAAAFAVSTAFRWKAVFLVEIDSTGSGGTCVPTLEYVVVAAAPNILPGSAAVNSVTSLTGPTGTSAAVATNSSFTIRIDALWGNVAGAPTITHVSTHFERLGP